MPPFWPGSPPSFGPFGFGELLVELSRVERRVVLAGAGRGKRAARNAGRANGWSDNREHRASWRAEVRNMVARWMVCGWKAPRGEEGRGAGVCVVVKYVAMFLCQGFF